MNPVTVGLGVAALLFGFYSLYVRLSNPTKFAKLAAMKQFWGEKLGGAIHFVAYTLVPLGVGVVLIFAGLRGINVF